MFRLLSLLWLKDLERKNPESILQRSLNLLDQDITEELRDFVRRSQSESGGFRDRAGNPDLYYTLFGSFVADALDMSKESSAIWPYVRQETALNEPEGVHLHCAAILYSKYGQAGAFRKSLGRKLRKASHPDKQPVYETFLSLISYYYLKDIRGILMTGRKLKALSDNGALPCPLAAASLVLAKSFGRNVNNDCRKLMSFYDGKGGFRATQTTPVSDLLSTAVALYALKFAGHDLREIKPDALAFTDSLFIDGGFSGHPLDPDPDIEYTFYGLLALGSLY